MIAAMRGVLGSVLLVLLVAPACADPKAAVAVVTPPPLVIAPIDAAAPSPPPKNHTAAPSCVVAPCTAARGVVAMTVVGTDVWGIASFSSIAPVALLRRGKDDAAETEILADVRPTSSSSINRILGDSAGLVLRTTDGLATWTPPQTASRVISTEVPIAEIALDGDSIFLVMGDCAARRQPRSGGPSTLLGRAVPKLRCSSPIVTYDASDVFFNAPEQVYAIPRAGGAARQLATFPPDTHILGLHVDASSLWILATTVVRGPHAALHRVPKPGGKIERVRFIDRSGPLNSLAGDATHLFWIENMNQSHTIMRMSKDGGDAIVVSQGDAQAHTLVATPDFLFWGREGNPARDAPHDVLRLARREY